MALYFNNIHIVRKLNNRQSVHTSLSVDDIVIALTENFSEHDIPVVDKHNIRHRTLVIAVGGDGTMLYAARLALENDAPVVGFNLGKLGFLTEFSPEDVDIVVHDILIPGNIKSEERMALLLQNKDGAHHTAFNEFVLAPIGVGMPLETFDVYSDGRQVATYNASGLIISTPTGSTAFAVAVGGAIISPDVRAIQIVPIAPHSLAHGSHPVILSKDAVIDVTVHNPRNPIGIIADGQTIIESPARVSMGVDIRKNPKDVTLFHARDWNFFDVLGHKMNWR